LSHPAEALDPRKRDGNDKARPLADQGGTVEQDRPAGPAPRPQLPDAGALMSQSSMTMLTVSEIYQSIQGESTHVGRPCVFVRLTACNLRCRWCDTPYAFTGGRTMSVDDVLQAVRAYGAGLVELTGGEPLLQPDVYVLIDRLIEAGHEILLETGGQIPLDEVPDEVVTIVDVKCPASGESAAMHWPNLDLLSAHDEVKFVIQDRADFDYACAVVDRHCLVGRTAAVLFSPVFGVLAPADLARWMLDAQVQARLQLQTHKYIWDPAARGV
jgi:7-carboxy-7-deazaguanine synthase